MSDGTNYVTPVGRLIEGSVFTGSDKGWKNKPNDKGEDGKPMLKWYAAIAIEKTNPDLPAFLQILAGGMKQAWPQFKGNFGDPTQFSAKIIDGDNPKFADKELYKGHYIFKMESRYPPNVFAADCKRVITNPDEVKRGYYIQAAGSYQTNGDSDKIGMKAWMNKVLFRYEGDELKSSADAGVFGGGQDYKPAGAVQRVKSWEETTSESVHQTVKGEHNPGTVEPDFGFLGGGQNSDLDDDIAF